MRAIRQDLVDNLAIEKGSLWDQMIILIKGDYTSLSCRGQIRDEEDGELYANFQFEPLITVTRDGEVYTRVRPYLGATRTKSLPTTKPRQFLKYDIELFNALNQDIVYRLALGDVEVSLNITLP
ncbi:MAG: hypothetical protein ACK518_02145 [bacterium]|jgi:hypothetical protein